MENGILKEAFDIAKNGKDRAPGTGTKGTDSWWFFSNEDFQNIFDELGILYVARFGQREGEGIPAPVPAPVPAGEDAVPQPQAQVAAQPVLREVRGGGGSNAHNRTKKRRLDKKGGSKKVTKKRK